MSTHHTIIGLEGRKEGRKEERKEGGDWVLFKVPYRHSPEGKTLKNINQDTLS